MTTFLAPRQRTLLKQQFLDLGMNNALELEVRGDGRPYIVNIQTSSLHQEDLYQAFLYTRGGPAWQTVQVRWHFCL